MRKLFFLLIVLIFQLSCSEENTTSVSNNQEGSMVSYINVSPQEAKALIDTVKNIVVVDVSPKYNISHIPGSINFYIGDGSIDSAISNLDTSFTYLIYCHVDAASYWWCSKIRRIRL